MQVTIQIQDDLLAVLLARAHEASATVESFLDETLREALDQPVAESTIVDGLLLSAIEGVQKVEAGAEFSIDDVLEEEQWNSMTNGERKSLGRRFRKEAEGAGIAEWLRRSTGNKAIYKKL